MIWYSLLIILLLLLLININNCKKQYSFQIQYNSSCIKRDIKDHIINPFAWLEHASFSGESSYNGHSLHVWEYIVCLFLSPYITVFLIYLFFLG